MTFRDPRFYVQPSPVFCPDQPFISGVLISPIAQAQLWTVVVCKLLSQTKVDTMTNGTWSVTLELIVRLSSHERSQRDISRITWVSQGVISKLIRHARETSIPTQRLRGYRLKATTPKEDRAFLHIMRGHMFLSAAGIIEELLRKTGCLCLQGTGTTSISWISTKTFRQMHRTDPWSSPPPPSPHVFIQLYNVRSLTISKHGIGMFFHRDNGWKCNG